MTASSAPHLFCFGLGYTAEALARTMLAKGWRVAGTVREPARADELRKLGIEIFAFDRARALADPVAALGLGAHVLSSIPPDEDGDPALDRHAADLIAARPRWIGYLSTTGVYGDAQGEWVDETTPPRPRLARGRRRLLAEMRWRGLVPAAHVFRLAGIYGPGRSALDALREGRARRWVKPGQVFCRIHVADIVRALIASMARPNPGQVYNLADNNPAPPQDAVAFAAALLGIEPPPEEPFAPERMSPMAASFYADNRRVANDRARQELGLSLLYPSYRVGLTELHRQGH
ncbi:MAG: SDR family NAD(P)-dependent oxidoreductase [Alphaproteobacteria bacterium]|nr:SDR family NAD(P)-dependent oxidoreductase [Alphaproteobacteria bacterium]